MNIIFPLGESSGVPFTGESGGIQFIIKKSLCVLTDITNIPTCLLEVEKTPICILEEIVEDIECELEEI